MYSCYLHGWNSHIYMCPACLTTETTSGTQVNFTPKPELHELKQEHARTIDLLQKELADYKEQLDWSLRNEKKYKECLNKRFEHNIELIEENIKLTTMLERASEIISSSLLLDEQLDQAWDDLNKLRIVINKELEEIE